MRDPYLIPGQICEMSDEKDSCVGYFYKYRTIIPSFKMLKKYKSELYDCENYKPIGTEWDPGRFPEWAVCSTVDQDGEIKYWAVKTFVTINTELGKHGSTSQTKYFSGGLCPDLSRWEGDAWKTSLRMKPEWAV